MTTERLINHSTNTEIVKNVIKAKSFFQRAKGLLGKNSIPSDEVLWIERCPSVHTFFMKFPIDVVFVDKEMKVTKIHKNLKPWRMTAILQFRNHSCFEFSANTVLDKIKKGDKLYVQT